MHITLVEECRSTVHIRRSRPLVDEHLSQRYVHPCPSGGWQSQLAATPFTNGEQAISSWALWPGAGGLSNYLNLRRCDRPIALTIGRSSVLLPCTVVFSQVAQMSEGSEVGCGAEANVAPSRFLPRSLDYHKQINVHVFWHLFAHNICICTAHRP